MHAGKVVLRAKQPFKDKPIWGSNTHQTFRIVLQETSLRTKIKKGKRKNSRAINALFDGLARRVVSCRVVSQCGVVWCGVVWCVVRCGTMYGVFLRISYYDLIMGMLRSCTFLLYSLFFSFVPGCARRCRTKRQRLPNPDKKSTSIRSRTPA